MKSWLKKMALLLACLPAFGYADDDSFAPGGTAIDHHTEQFHDQKIVMDLKAGNIETLKYATMVASRITAHPGAKLVVIVEGPLVSVFAKKNYLDHQGMVDKWAEYAKNGVHVEYCGNSVAAAKLQPSDMEGLDEKNPATVNSGAFPALANWESQGYNLVIPMAMPAPAKSK